MSEQYKVKRAVLLAGGFGTRISEESQYRPKPMVEIGGRPILWHIMKQLYHQGIREFIICAGYKQEYIKNWFLQYSQCQSDVTLDFKNSTQPLFFNNKVEDWKVTIIDTGLHTNTGGRLKLVRPYLNDEDFLITYGDGVSDIDLSKLLKTHYTHTEPVTMSTYKYAQNKGILEVSEDGKVEIFREKSESDSELINIGYMIMNSEVFDYIESLDDSLEKNALKKMVEDGKVNSYQHKGFWQCMDTAKEKETLENLWAKGNAPWKTWQD